MYLRFCLDELQDGITRSIIDPLVSASLSKVLPSEVTALRSQINDLISRIYALGTPYDPSEEDLSLLRKALLQRRKAYTAENENLQLKTSHQDILKQLQERLAPIERMITSGWFIAGKPFTLPKLTDFLSIQEIYSLQKKDLAPPKHVYDEKFGILLSPSQFLPRLALARLESQLRGTSTSVAFMDIDDFKSFNTQFGEFVIDKAVLPIFMRSIEAHIHSHGHAFRFGGDEYMLLLPNHPHDSAVKFCQSFQRKLPLLLFPSVDKRLTVSIGISTAGPESPLTDRELHFRANAAEKTAKGKGKDCVAWTNGDDLNMGDAVVYRANQ
jgi:diguanylate cyclase (GGDEF)-like protein